VSFLRCPREHVLVANSHTKCGRRLLGDVCHDVLGVDSHLVDDVGRQGVGDCVDARLHSAEIRPQWEAPGCQRLEENERPCFLHDGRKESDVAAREEMLELRMREVASEDHAVESNVLARQLEVVVEQAAATQLLEELADSAEFRGFARSVGVALEHPSAVDDPVDQRKVSVLERPDERFHHFTKRPVTDEKESHAGIFRE
jgi:hypothetical protein